MKRLTPYSWLILIIFSSCLTGNKVASTDKQIESLLQMYKKQVVINILKTLNDNGTILSDGDMEKRLSQIKTMPFEEFKQTETQIYNLLKQLSKRQFGDTQEIETRISRMSSAMDNKNLEISDTYQELEI